ncbi:S41 family peptidase [Deinococcus cellulosilyticus]|uniref:Peptidase S41 n=1 Tax=Deinococcus cellulosilyticus (strain DSM 18568 / NBRC 106333 / KACC 11606 / 5516J-15) TaxID=1223518 RepID=A0A511N6T3_DEIC1|nr:S41 family peptidase [Deinococcus cellulosilyticus]GEM48187.1 peptidase S41 [Deinococcus cellulosilyticus NBRC 106333 = KACC 11606]
MKLNGKVALVLLGLTSTLAIGYAQLRSYQTTSSSSNATVQEQTFRDIYNAIKSEYLTPVEEKKLWEGAISGLIGSLEDQFTYYTPPEDNVYDQQELEGQFFGIGATLTPSNPDGSGATISELMQGMPAQQAGLQIGDRVLKVNGEDVTKLTLTKVVQKIRGEENTSVKLEIERAGATLNFDIARKKITDYAVYTEILPGNVGYVQVRTFYNKQIFSQVDQALKTMSDKKVDKLILDLRDNGGGLLCGGIYVADAFLNKGNIVSLKDRTGKESIPGSAFDSTCYGVAKAAKTDYTGKMVVLVNRNSASASEIVAGALQDNDRARVIGEKTFGKGVAQDVINNLPDGGKLALVANEWLTPDGRSIHKVGITPDITVEDSRFPKVVTLEGTGAAPGEKIKMTIGGKEVELTADKEGKFTYTQVGERRQPPAGSRVDLTGDTILKKGLEVLNQQ